MTLDEYIERFYVKQLIKYANKRTGVVTSLEEIEQRHCWFVKNSF